MDDLIAFLRAIYDKQAADHRQVRDGCMRCGSDWPCYPMRDIDSKRRILDEHHPRDPCDAHDASFETIPCDTLLLLALPHADRPDYREEWKP